VSQPAARFDHSGDRLYGHPSGLSRLKGHFNQYIATKPALAGQNIALVELFLGQHIAEILQRLDLAFHQTRAAGATAADPAVMRPSKSCTQGGIEKVVLLRHLEALPGRLDLSTERALGAE